MEYISRAEECERWISGDGRVFCFMQTLSPESRSAVTRRTGGQLSLLRQGRLVRPLKLSVDLGENPAEPVWPSGKALGW